LWGEGVKADRKYEVLTRLVYGILDGKASAAEYTTHKLLEARCPGQDKSMIVVVA
jgi:hypothetical protein